jgi:hypothetical protein
LASYKSLRSACNVLPNCFARVPSVE